MGETLGFLVATVVALLCDAVVGGLIMAAETAWLGLECLAGSNRDCDVARRKLAEDWDLFWLIWKDDLRSVRQELFDLALHVRGLARDVRAWWFR